MDAPQKTRLPDPMTLTREMCDTTSYHDLYERFTGIPSAVAGLHRKSAERIAFFSDHPDLLDFGACAAALSQRLTELHPEAQVITDQLVALSDTYGNCSANRMDQVLDSCVGASQCAHLAMWHAIVASGDLRAVKAYHSRFHTELMAALKPGPSVDQ